MSWQISNIFRLIIALLVPTLPLAYVHAQSSKTSPTATPQVIGGDVISPEQSGAVEVLTPGHLCSGTLLTNLWVITAAHCQVDIATPSNNTLKMGSQSSAAVFAVNHPSLDFALLKLGTAMKMANSTTGYRLSLYQGTGVSLEGKNLTCRGYGCNAYKSTTDLEDCTGDDGTLRQAILTVKKGATDNYNFTVEKNSRGQVLAPGDSGSGCFETDNSSWNLAGVYKSGSTEEGNAGIPENWRDWANAYVNGTPIPLPQHWFVYTSQHPTFLMPPLPNSYQDQYTWNECPDGKPYSFTPSFSLETGKDFITLSAGSTTVTLTGIGMTSCVASGPMTASIRTDAANPSTGLLSMPVSCDTVQPISQVPSTVQPVAVSGVGQSVYFFATTQDQRVMYQTAIAGQAGLCWSEVDGSVRTSAGPAGGAVGDHIFVAVKGTDGEILINQADLGHAFGGWSPANITSDTAPAVVGAGDYVYVFAKTTDGRIMYNIAKLGQAGAGWKEVSGNGRTNVAPAAGAVGSHVFLLIRGLNGQVQVNQADAGQSFGNWFPGGITTNVSPAAVGVGNQIYFFVTGTDGRIMFNHAELGQGGTGWQEVSGDGRSNIAPAAGAIASHVYVSIVESSGRIVTNQADLGSSFGSWF